MFVLVVRCEIWNMYMSASKNLKIPPPKWSNTRDWILGTSEGTTLFNIETTSMSAIGLIHVPMFPWYIDISDLGMLKM